jgi:hypothetical protein
LTLINSLIGQAFSIFIEFLHNGRTGRAKKHDVQWIASFVNETLLILGLFIGTVLSDLRREFLVAHRMEDRLPLGIAALNSPEQPPEPQRLIGRAPLPVGDHCETANDCVSLGEPVDRPWIRLRKPRAFHAVGSEVPAGVRLDGLRVGPNVELADVLALRRHPNSSQRERPFVVGAAGFEPATPAV